MDQRILIERLALLNARAITMLYQGEGHFCNCCGKYTLNDHLSEHNMHHESCPVPELRVLLEMLEKGKARGRSSSGGKRKRGTGPS